jgi:hypothetical protein
MTSQVVITAGIQLTILNHKYLAYIVGYGRVGDD